MSLLVMGISGILLLFLLFFLKVPIPLAMISVGYLGYGAITSFTAANRIAAGDIFTTFTAYSLSVIPMFVLMGFLGYHSGMGTRLYSFAYKAVGSLPGGLAMASQVACAIFGAICGSSTATTATIGSIAIPEMRRYGYSTSLATASIAAGGALGIMIPPSVILVLYGVATEQSIAMLFLAGIIPGLLLTLLYMSAIFMITLRNPSLGPPAPHSRFNLKILAGSLGGELGGIIFVFTLSLGGLLAGWFTPTEAGGVGVAGIMLVIRAQKQLTMEVLNNALADATRTSAMIFLLIAGAIIFGRFMTLTRLPLDLASWAGALPFPSFVVLLIILLIFLVLGTFIDSLPLMLLTVPIFFPVVVNSLGYDPIWFGVIMVLVVTMGCITPPVGINVFVVKGIAADVPLFVIFRGIWPFLIAVFLCCLILIVFPQLATFLPQMLRN
jgi:tripartite ATP-independent transporter DctM subunit